MHLVCEVMELPVPNSLDAAAGAVVKSSHEITVPVFFWRGQNVAGGNGSYIDYF